MVVFFGSLDSSTVISRHTSRLGSSLGGILIAAHLLSGAWCATFPALPFVASLFWRDVGLASSGSEFTFLLMAWCSLRLWHSDNLPAMVSFIVSFPLGLKGRGSGPDKRGCLRILGLIVRPCGELW